MELTDVNLDMYHKVMQTSGLCRDRYGWFNVTMFHLLACSQCYSYLFPELRNTLKILSRPASEYMEINGSMVPPETVLYPDLFQDAVIKNKEVCDYLGDVNCKRLESCCNAAIECCSKQTQEWTTSRINNTHKSLTYCPRTWDGFGCFKETEPGETATISCPAYFDDNLEGGIVEKLCTTNGDWLTNPLNGQEWTDYSTCVSLEGYRILYYVCVICHTISLMCLIPACIIFIRYRQLRKQHRIRIHINLCASFILTSSAWLGWDHLIFRDRLENPQEDTIMHRKTVQELCKILYVISRYSWACNCFWMSLEGFHLHRLINQAFKAPKSIVSYYFVGWLVPLLPTSVYSIVRIMKYDSGCWVSNILGLEWIMYTPNVMCILVNMGFLINIVRILVTQLQRHPNEPSNYRRALKATFILTPLFGLQMFLIVHQPEGNLTNFFPYEVFARIISNSQGTAVATIFCFLNSEVHGQIRAHVSCIQTRHSSNENHSFTCSSEMRRPSTYNNSSENIPLNCSGFFHRAINGGSGSKRSSSSVLSSKCQMGQSNGKPVRGQML